MNQCQMIGKHMLLGGRGARLPAEYQKVEWIASSGSQWIDTGLTANECNTIEVKGSTYSKSSSQYLAGVANSSGTAIGWAVIFKAHNYLTYYPLSWSDASIGKDIANNEVFTIKSIIKPGEQELWINGTLKDTSSSELSKYGSAEDISIFALHRAGAHEYRYNGNIYYVKMWQDDILIMDLLPCYRKSDGEVGMYDLVTGTFFTNKGSGAFTKGADV